VIIRTRKNDPEGVRHRYFFPRGVLSDTRLYDFSTVLWEFVRIAKPAASRPLFVLVHGTFRVVFNPG